MPLRVENLCFGYGRGRAVLSGLSAAFEPGGVTALVGPNGSGKSTLLRLLLGLLRPRSGRVTLDGRDLLRIPAPERARRLAFVPQRPAVSFAYPVRRVVAFGLHAGAMPGRDADRRAMEALERLGLADRADEPFGTLSVGQQQRAALARALAQLGPGLERGGPPLFLLVDEPTSAMDPRHALEAMDLLRRLAASSVGVVVAMHDLSLARRYADRALVLDKAGRSVAHGPAGAALGAEVLERVFGVRFAELRDPESGAVAAVPVGAVSPPIACSGAEAGTPG